jgi:hypothetical protein
MKTKVLEKPGVCICALTGDEFPHNNSKAGRAAAMDKVAQHQAAALTRMSEREPSLTVRQHFFPATIPHTETRTKEELRANRVANAQKRPSGVPATPVNPFEKTIEAEISRHHALWETSYGGRRKIAELKRESKKWEAEQERQRQQTALNESVKPAVDHATNVLNELQRDPTITVAELELAQSRVQLARDGKLEEYATADREWRDTQRKKIEDAAVEVDSQIRTLAAKRDTLLQAAYAPVNEPAEPQLVPVTYPDFYHDAAKAGKTLMEPMPVIG